MVNITIKLFDLKLVRVFPKSKKKSPSNSTPGASPMEGLGGSIPPITL